MIVKEVFFSKGSFNVGNGKYTHFWEGLGDTPLVKQYPSLYNIAQRKDALIAHDFASTNLSNKFKCSLTGSKWMSWLQLVDWRPLR